MKTFQIGPKNCLLLLLCLVTSASGQTPERLHDKITRNAADATACKAQLNRIHEALSEYQRKYKRLPNWLSELNPEFIDDPKTFICPFVRTLGDFQGWRDGIRGEVFHDPHLNISYAYEFCAREYSLGEGLSTTVQEYKKRQVGQLGLWATEVPILRCFAHRPILNVPLRGRIYESETDWEDNFSEVVNLSELLPAYLFSDRTQLAPRSNEAITPRDPNLGSEFVNLAKYYTASVTDSWQPNPFRGNDLANLPQGTVRFGPIGISFDVRGVIQLSGKPFAGAFSNEVECIQVDRNCRLIHFLHATAFHAKKDSEVGRYEIRYANGQRQKVPIIYGKDVLDWWFDPKVPRTEAVRVAWEGVNDAAKSQGKLIRLYHSPWENPLPDLSIQCISFISALGDAAPFLVAITLE